MVQSIVAEWQIDLPGDLVWDLPCVQQASYLEGGPLMWMLPLYLHVNQKSDYAYDDDMNVFDVYVLHNKYSNFSWVGLVSLAVNLVLLNKLMPLFSQSRIIPGKCGQNPISGLGDAVWRNCLRTVTGQTKCDHKSSPCHYVTKELNKWPKKGHFSV